MKRRKEMSQSRFFDDETRIVKRLEMSQNPGEYYLNAPGPGSSAPMEEDVHMLMQRWGANMFSNTVNLESDLMGINRNINRHHTDYYDYKSNMPDVQPLSFLVDKPFVEESRASHPAWTYKDVDQSPYYISFPLLNPQNLATIEKPFLYDVQTRILQRNEMGKMTVPSFDPRNIFPLASIPGKREF